MRQISIKQLRSNMSKEMGNLPFEVTEHGKVIAVMCTKYGYTCHDSELIPLKGVHKGGNEDKPRKTSNCNHNTKPASCTGGRPKA